MIEGFDKEIDALLRQTAKSETVFTASNPQSQITNPKSFHLDADAISAFAENVLPEKLKQNYTAHFAECDRCRTILANTMALGAETESATALVAAAPKINAVSIPWYRKFLAFPRIAYALGALVVLFGGFFAFLVVRESGDALGSVDVSQTDETQPRASGPNFDIEPEFSAPQATPNAMTGNMASSNTMMSNSASTAATNMSGSVPANSAAVGSNANSSAAPKPNPPKEAPTTENERAAADQKAAESRADTETITTENGNTIQQTDVKNRSAGQTLNEKKAEAERDAPSADSSVRSERNTVPTVGNAAGLSKTKTRKPNLSGSESRQIDGKTFARKEGVWYDADYNGQPTTNVSRGSSDYQKLDPGLRSTAAGLSGTVVIVWRNKAYRIQ